MQPHVPGRTPHLPIAGCTALSLLLSLLCRAAEPLWEMHTDARLDMPNDIARGAVSSCGTLAAASSGGEAADCGERSESQPASSGIAESCVVVTTREACVADDKMEACGEKISCAGGDGVSSGVRRCAAGAPAPIT